MLFMERHSHINADTVGDQPDAPDKDTETIEVGFCLHGTFEVGPNRPKCMDKHQDDGCYASYGMNRIVQVSYLCDMLHESCSYSIGKQSADEEDQMPGFKLPLDTFAPYSDGIKNQRRRYNTDRCD